MLDVLRWGYVGVLVLLALSVSAGLMRHVRRHRAGRAVEQAEAAAYREHRGARLTATDGRDLGRLVGRSARRRAEQDGGPHAA